MQDIKISELTQRLASVEGRQDKDAAQFKVRSFAVIGST
jgi:hypothetical protein